MVSCQTIFLQKNIQKELKKLTKVAEKLRYNRTEFLVQEKKLLKIEDSIDLLLLIDDGKSHHVCIKDFDRFMFRKQKIKTKNGFVENVLIKCVENYLSINGKQSVKLEKGIISLKIVLNKYQFLLKFMLILSVI